MSNEKIEFKLTDAELLAVQAIIDTVEPNTYTLRKLFGTQRWKALGKGSERQEYGERFKASFMLGELANVELHPNKTSANAVQYIVRGEYPAG